GRRPAVLGERLAVPAAVLSAGQVAGPAPSPARRATKERKQLIVLVVMTTDVGEQQVAGQRQKDQPPHRPPEAASRPFPRALVPPRLLLQDPPRHRTPISRTQRVRHVNPRLARDVSPSGSPSPPSPPSYNS